MRPVVLTTNDASGGAKNSSAYKVDHFPNPTTIGFGVVVTGTVSYTVQHTFDDVDGSGTVTWFPHASVAAQTANKDGNYAFPVRAIRLNQASGSGSCVMTLIQSGGGNGFGC